MKKHKKLDNKRGSAKPSKPREPAKRRQISKERKPRKPTKASKLKKARKITKAETSQKLATPHRGRRTLIDDATLHNNRDRLVQLFEGWWGEIGWSFRKCKKPDDLVPLFCGLTGAIWENVISAFCTPSSAPSSRATLSKLRLESRAIVKPRRDAVELNRQAQERLERAQSALAYATENQLSLVKGELKKRDQKAQEAGERYRILDDRDNELRAQIKLVEASFARRELFEFLKSKRYELSPLSLANAAAGLPYMGWRRSISRCLKEPSVSANGLNYQVFKAIRYLISKASKKTEEGLVEHFRTSIPTLPARYRYPQTDLAEKWFFLERALREACRAKVQPKTLPFEITKRYKQPQAQTHTDILLAEVAKLSISD